MTSTPRSPLAPTTDAPVSRIHKHIDGQGPFWVVVCTEGWASQEYTECQDAHRAKANHDMAHADELKAAS